MADIWLTIEEAAVELGLSVRTVNRHISAGKLQSRLFEGRREVLVRLPDSDSDTTTHEHSNQDGQEESQSSPSTEPSANKSDERVASQDRSATTDREPPPHIREATEATTSRAEVGRTPEFVNAPSDSTEKMVLAIAERNAELTAAVYQNLARMAEQRATLLRRGAYLAWGTVALMAVGIAVAIGWTTYRLTRQQGQSDELARRVAESTKAADEAQAKAKSVEDEAHSKMKAMEEELSAAQQRTARAEGRLSVMTDVAFNARPTSAPSTKPTVFDRFTKMFGSDNP